MVAVSTTRADPGKENYKADRRRHDTTDSVRLRRPITQSKLLNSDCCRDARLESSTKKVLAVKIMLVIGNRINYSVAQFRVGSGIAGRKPEAGTWLESQTRGRKTAVVHRLREF